MLPAVPACFPCTPLWRRAGRTPTTCCACCPPASPRDLSFAESGCQPNNDGHLGLKAPHELLSNPDLLLHMGLDPASVPNKVRLISAASCPRGQSATMPFCRALTEAGDRRPRGVSPNGIRA